MKNDYSFQNDYATKYSDNFLQSIIKYLSNGTFLQSIEDIRSEKKAILIPPKLTKLKLRQNFQMQKDNLDSWYQQKEDIRLLSIFSLEMNISL